LALDAIFFDRDGVINKDYGYVSTEDRLDFIDGVFDFCASLPPNVKKFIVTNQAGIARGYYDSDQLKKLMKHIFDEFDKKNIVFSDWSYCPHHPQFTGFCECRKPSPKMIQKFLESYRIDPKNCALIGDNQTDIEAGIAAGLKVNILLNGSEETVKKLTENNIPYHAVSNYADATLLLKNTLMSRFSKF
jgi:D-glycero-D-manno-heptose 1,7-bisphosphate phosphatase